MNHLSKLFKKCIAIALFFSVLLSWYGVEAQSDSSIARVEKGMFKFYFISPSAGYEYGITKKNTLYADVSLNLGMNVTFSFSDNLMVRGVTYLYPVVRAELRHYYNLKTRQQKGKYWRGNTGPFFAGIVQQGFTPVWRQPFGEIEITDDLIGPLTSIGAMWGYQHTAPKLSNLHFTFAVGPAIYLARNDIGFGFGASYVKLGFAFGDFDEKK